MKLAFRTLGEGMPLLILHGLFGSSDNWQTLARQYAEHFCVYLIDQRNHGHADHTDAHSYRLMADDLSELVEEQGLNDFHLMGHSMGGKTAMLFASENGHLIDKLIVADMAPKPYEVHHRALVDTLLKVDLDRVKSRGEVEKMLKAGISDAGTLQFFLKNLYWKEKGQLAWRFNLPVLSAQLEQMSEDTGQQICLVDTLFIRGAKSNYITDDDVQWLDHYFPNHRLYMIKDAGHWLHAEQPDEFFKATLEFLK